MQLSLDILETNASFKKKVIEAICDKLSNKFALASKIIENEIALNIKPFFKNTEQYKMLTSDYKTIADLGFRVGTVLNKVNAIIDVISNNVEVTSTRLTPTKNGIKGGLEIGILIADYSDILDLAEAHTITEKSFDIKWLEWILKDGPKIHFANYHVEYGPFGRSGKGHMVENGDGSVSITGGWRLGEALRGTPGNNWLTNALKDNKSEIQNMILYFLEKYIKV